MIWKYKGGILFMLLITVCSSLLLVWNSSWSDRLVAQEVPGYQAKSFGQSLLYYGVFTTLGLIFLGAVYVCARMVRTNWRGRRRQRLNRRIDQALRGSENYLPLYKKNSGFPLSRE